MRTTIECTIVYRLKTIVQCNFLEIVARWKSIWLNGLYTEWNIYFSNPITVIECLIANRVNTLGKCYTGQIIVVIESIITYTGNLILLTTKIDCWWHNNITRVFIVSTSHFHLISCHIITQTIVERSHPEYLGNTRNRATTNIWVKVSWLCSNTPDDDITNKRNRIFWIVHKSFRCRVWRVATINRIIKRTVGEVAIVVINVRLIGIWVPFNGWSSYPIIRIIIKRLRRWLYPSITLCINMHIVRLGKLNGLTIP